VSRPFWIGAAVGLGLELLLLAVHPFLLLVLHYPALWAIGYTKSFDGVEPRLVQVALLLSALVYAALLGALTHLATRRRRRRRPRGPERAAEDPDH
jgi:hypothetical protein